MNFFKLTGLLCILAFPVATYSQAACEKLNIQLIHYQKSNPIKDADELITSRTPKLVGVYGYSLTIPGLKNKEEVCYSKILPIEGIKGTSDFIQCPNQAELNQVATVYAEQFNRRVLKYLKTTGVRCKPAQ